MGKFDKDRHQKQLALRYCLAQGYLPCLEVVVNTTTDLTSKPEVLTDVDVLGIENVADGSLRRILFDCKSSTKLSAISRAFWASGLMSYTGSDGAFVIMGKPAVFNHRISALKVDVDLHDEKSFEELGKTVSEDFNTDSCYQSAIERWDTVYNSYTKYKWTEETFLLCRDIAPLSQKPEQTFRKILGAIRKQRGNFDPAKDDHVAIMLDVLSYMFVLWSRMGRDLRRIYSPSMKRENFEDALRLYVWGGHEAYAIRQAILEKSQRAGMAADTAVDLQEFPAWKRFVSFVGLVISSPNDIFDCAYICRELSVRRVSGRSPDFDAKINKHFDDNNRLTQFITAATSYVVEACRLPKDFEKIMNDEIMAKR